MRTTLLLAAMAFVVIVLLVHSVVAPVALRRDGKPSSADLSHPPSEFGASSVVSSPHETRK